MKRQNTITVYVSRYVLPRIAKRASSPEIPAPLSHFSANRPETQNHCPLLALLRDSLDDRMQSGGSFEM